MSLFRLTGAALISLSAFGCSPQKAPAPALGKYLAHTVTITGENLSLLAQWYTGDSRNWRSLFIPAPAGELRRLKPGDQVLVPYGMLKKRDAPTKEYVAAHQLPPAPHRSGKAVAKKGEEHATVPPDELESEFLRQMVIVNENEASSEQQVR